MVNKKSRAVVRNDKHKRIRNNISGTASKTKTCCI